MEKKMGVFKQDVIVSAARIRNCTALVQTSKITEQNNGHM